MHLWPIHEGPHVCCSDVSLLVISFDRKMWFAYVNVNSNHRKKVGVMTDGTKPAAMTIPEGGVFKDKVEQGRYGPIFPKTPACYGFSIIAKIIPDGNQPFMSTPGTSRRPWLVSPTSSLS